MKTILFSSILMISSISMAAAEHDPSQVIVCAIQKGRQVLAYEIENPADKQGSVLEAKDGEVSLRIFAPNVASLEDSGPDRYDISVYVKQNDKDLLSISTKMGNERAMALYNWTLLDTYLGECRLIPSSKIESTTKSYEEAKSNQP